MKNLLTGIAAAALLCAASVAQETIPATQPATTPPQEQPVPSPATTPSAAPTQQPSSPSPATAQPASPQSTTAQPPASSSKIAPGSVIPVQLTKTIDAKKMKTGDPIEARVTQDLKAVNGQLIVPKDTKIVGHVTESQPRNKEQKESQVGIAFDRAVMKEGGDVNMPMSIQAIISPDTLNPGANNNGGEQPTSQSPSAPASGAGYGNGAGRAGNMGSGAPQQAPSTATTQSPKDSGANNSHQPITGETQGVVGFSNLKLAAATNASNGSVLTSDKNNVKVDSGTFMLLRVNQ